MSRISPTAHYTGEVWHRHGLSHDALSTPTGRWLHMLLGPLNRAYERLGHRSLDTMLLARHRGIDRVLARAVDSGEVGQVLEIAAGLSPRGMRFAQRYRGVGLLYVESDLPAMAERKRRILDRAGLRGANHRVVVLDALAPDGPAGLSAVLAEHFDPGRGIAVVTEGLIPYLDRTMLDALWRRIAHGLAGFPRGLYLSDVNPRGEIRSAVVLRAFHLLLQQFTRGRVFLHFDSPAAVAAALALAGFGEVAIRDPAELGGAQDTLPTSQRASAAADAASEPAPGRPVVRIIAARTGQDWLASRP